MTQEQRLNHRCEQIYGTLIDHMQAVMEKNGHSAESVAGYLDVSSSTVNKMLRGEIVTLNATKWCRLLVLCGLELKPKGGAWRG
jgi:predicted XRE-type DNA-binding protein